MGRSDVRAEEDPASDAREDASVDRSTADSDGALQEALDAFRAGEPICVHDAADREGEVDLFYPAAAVDAAALERLRNDAGGLICVALAARVADAADLPYLSEAIDHPAAVADDLAYGDRPSFSVTVNHRETYTGVTDEDRALTISEVGTFAGAVDAGAVEDPMEAFAADFRIPGHVHLLRAAPSLLAERRGHTELAIALAEAAGIAPAVVVCEMLDDDSGDALSVDDARAYARREAIPFLEGAAIVSALAG